MSDWPKLAPRRRRLFPGKPPSDEVGMHHLGTCPQCARQGGTSQQFARQDYFHLPDFNLLPDDQPVTGARPRAPKGSVEPI